MADGENGTKAEHAEPNEPTNLQHPAMTDPIATSSNVPRPENVWTASDARGPLSEAGATDMPAHDPDLAPHPDLPSEDGRSAAEAATPGPMPAGPDIAAPAPHRSALPIVAGLVVGAIIGATSALAFYSYETGSADSDADRRIAALSSRVDTLQDHPPADPALASLKTNVTDLGGKLASLQQNVAALRAADKTAAPAQASPSLPAFDPAPLRQKIDALQGALDALRKETSGVPAMDAKVAALATAIAALPAQTAAIKGLDGQVADLKTGLGDARKQSAAAQSDIATLQAGQKTLEGKVTSSPALAVVADSLVEQIDHGAPYAGQVAALTSLGADAAQVAVLKENADKGVPSAKALAAAFDPLVDPMVASDRHVAPNASFMDRMKSGMFSMVSIRRVDDTSGDDLGSRVARIQADLTHDDVAAAFATWDALPPAAKAKSEAWGAQAKTHAEAMTAAHALQTQAIQALGTKKS